MKKAYSYTSKQRKEYESQWKTVQTTPAQNGNNAKNEHTNGKSTHKGISLDLVENRKKANCGTRGNLDSHTWRKYQKVAIIATTIRQDNLRHKVYHRQHTGVLAIYQPRSANVQSAWSTPKWNQRWTAYKITCLLEYRNYQTPNKNQKELFPLEGSLQHSN